jgi:hypothetical protein
MLIGVEIVCTVVNGVNAVDELSIDETVVVVIIVVVVVVVVFCKRQMSNSNFLKILYQTVHDLNRFR